MTTSRRVLATRDTRWAKALASSLARAGVRPNAVSVLGLAFAAAACLAFVVVPTLTGLTKASVLIAAGAAIQLRLLCNLLDGMLAVEEGFQTMAGEIYNDVPDRIADVIVLSGAGYAVRDMTALGPAAGWLAATVALFTAYVRVLGGSIGVTPPFVGPMAKQHRMFVLTIAAAIAAYEATLGLAPRAVFLGLVAIIAGGVVTVLRRTRRILDEASR